MAAIQAIWQPASSVMPLLLLKRWIVASTPAGVGHRKTAESAVSTQHPLPRVGNNSLIQGISSRPRVWEAVLLSKAKTSGQTSLVVKGQGFIVNNKTSGPI